MATPKVEKDKETVSTGIILKFIKPFDGTREKLNAFINNCNSAIELATNPGQENLVLKFILSQLEGKAESACSIKEFETWDSLKEFLKTQFGEQKHYAHLLADLQECRQGPNENVTQFSLRLETCLSQLLTEVTISNSKKSELAGRLAAMQDLALHAFIMGLIPRISNIVRCREPRTLNEAINFATSEEKIQHYSYKYNVLSKQKNAEPRRNDSNQRASKPNNNDRPSPSTSSSTQSKEPFCRYCKRTGHLLEDCKLRQHNNSKNDKPTKPFSPVGQSTTGLLKPKTEPKAQVNLVEEIEEGYDEVDHDDLN